MNPWWHAGLALASSFGGMAALSLAMDRHHAQAVGRHPTPPRWRRAGRLLGGLLLTAALWPCIDAWGVAVGLIVWCGWLTVAAMAVATLLAYRPRWTPGLAALAGAGTAVLLCWR